ncbi:hypothetical protein BDW60DRAFT_176766 [Aspergillus nidulans var. acristatus]
MKAKEMFKPQIHYWCFVSACYRMVRHPYEIDRRLHKVRALEYNRNSRWAEMKGKGVRSR